MAKVQRVGDRNSEGGKIIRGDNSVKVNGLPISVTDNPVTPHPKGKEHQNARTKANQSSVKVNGKPVVTTGATDTCGHKRVGGSPNVNIG